MNGMNAAVTISFSARFLPQSAASLPCLLQGVRGFVSSSASTYFVVTLSLCLVCAGLLGRAHTFVEAKLLMIRI